MAAGLDSNAEFIFPKCYKYLQIKVLHHSNSDASIVKVMDGGEQQRNTCTDVELIFSPVWGIPHLYRNHHLSVQGAFDCRIGHSEPALEAVEAQPCMISHKGAN